MKPKSLEDELLRVFLRNDPVEGAPEEEAPEVRILTREELFEEESHFAEDAWKDHLEYCELVGPLVTKVKPRRRQRIRRRLQDKGTRIFARKLGGEIQALEVLAAF